MRAGSRALRCGSRSGLTVPVPRMFALVLVPFLRLLALEFVILFRLLFLLFVVVLPRIFRAGWPRKNRQGQGAANCSDNDAVAHIHLLAACLRAPTPERCFR